MLSQAGWFAAKSLGEIPRCLNERFITEFLLERIAREFGCRFKREGKMDSISLIFGLILSLV
jgi:hypothetical protein